ncbi:MAG: histidinol-phosphatase [Treponema sp.]|jgi:histidinol-phosphatase (PHP family)|nr:histidinol-phosphatase [Treponema sp.]
MNPEKSLSSMHTHTIFCDGKDDVETMCRVAYEKELCIIGFSAHAPISRQIGKESGWNMKEDKVDQYVTEVLAAKERWKGKIDVFLGLEADYIKGIRSPLDTDITSLNLDYIIGSVHYLFPENGAEPFTVDGPAEEFEKGLKEGFNGDGDALMHCYYDAVTEMITMGGFDILGHVDIIKKNCNDKNYWSKENELSRQREIANLIKGKNSKSTNIIIEVNTGGLNRNKTIDVYPSVPFLQIIRECNIPVIITSDAHCAKHINGNYDVALNTLISLDFKEHYLFNSKINTIPVWQKIKLQKNI